MLDAERATPDEIKAVMEAREMKPRYFTQSAISNFVSALSNIGTNEGQVSTMAQFIAQSGLSQNEMMGEALHFGRFSGSMVMQSAGKDPMQILRGAARWDANADFSMLKEAEVDAVRQVVALFSEHGIDPESARGLWWGAKYLYANENDPQGVTFEDALPYLHRLMGGTYSNGESYGGLYRHGDYTGAVLLSPDMSHASVRAQIESDEVLMDFLDNGWFGSEGQLVSKNVNVFVAERPHGDGIQNLTFEDGSVQNFHLE